MSRYQPAGPAGHRHRLAARRRASAGGRGAGRRSWARQAVRTAYARRAVVRVGERPRPARRRGPWSRRRPAGEAADGDLLGADRRQRRSAGRCRPTCAARGGWWCRAASGSWSLKPGHLAGSEQPGAERPSGRRGRGGAGRWRARGWRAPPTWWRACSRALLVASAHCRSRRGGRWGRGWSLVADCDAGAAVAWWQPLRPHPAAATGRRRRRARRTCARHGSASGFLTVSGVRAPA